MDDPAEEILRQLEIVERGFTAAFEGLAKAGIEMSAANEAICGLIAKLESLHADKVFVAKDYTKADLISDLRRLTH